MPALVLWIGSMLLSVAGQWLIKALVGAGIGFATYHYAVGPAEDAIQNALGSGGSQFVAYAGWFGIDKAVTIIMSAVIARLAVKSATGVFSKIKKA